MSDQNQSSTPEISQPAQQSAEPPREPNRPADTVRDGALKATIWKNSGERGDFYSTQLSKSYQDREGNWRDGQSFTKDDLPKLGILTNQAYTRIGEMQRTQTQAQGQSQSQANAQRDAFAQQRSEPTAQQTQGLKR